MSNRARHLTVAAGLLLGLAAFLLHWFSAPARENLEAQQDSQTSPESKDTSSSETVSFATVSFATVAPANILKLQESCRFENVRSSGGLVGSQECATCHTEITESHALTGMGQSLGLMKPEMSPPDAVIDDSFSPRRYRVLHRDGVMWHQEWLAADPESDAATGPQRAPKEVLISEHPVKWQIGSGNHAKSYLLEIGITVKCRV